MSAPARQRARSVSARTATSSTTGTSAKSRTGSSGGKATKRSAAAHRAYAKRAHRSETKRQGGGLTRGRLGLQYWPKSRATFVIVLMGLMLCGVAASLWLSTQAIADSYRLEQLREQNAQLAERAEQLRREVGQLQSPSSLAERAKSLGMVPGGNPARLVVNEDGSIVVVGEPVEATAPDPPPSEDADDDGRTGESDDDDGAGDDGGSADSDDSDSGDGDGGGAGSDDR